MPTTDGLVLFWSLRNPHHPERIINVSSGVTALAFSNHHPNLLAVGLVDGSISIFDVHKEDEVLEPILDTSTLPGRHSAPVWQVKWVDKGVDQAEGLVSISSDGRVMEWSTSKGLSASLLMELKRTGNLQGKISNQANGLAFDFVHGDASLYIVSTEDGLLHKCSVSYNEQFLETYVGHTAPVYRVTTSPYSPPAFLSCGGDWTVKLWHLKDAKPVLSFQTLDLSAVVHDVAWSPHSSTVFASVTGDARLMLWDLSQSVIDPVIIKEWEGEEQDDTGASATSMPGGATGGAETSTREDPAAANNNANNASNSNNNNYHHGAPPGGPETNLESPAPPAKARPEYTSVSFYHETPVVAVGDSHGMVTVYRMVDLVNCSDQLSREDQEKKLTAAMYPKLSV
jgi:WD40 repeat protein